MAELRTLDVVELVVPRRVLRCPAPCGVRVKLHDIQPLSDDKPRNFIARARAIDGAGRVRPVIVKATRSPHYDPPADNALKILALSASGAATAHIGDRRLAVGMARRWLLVTCRTAC